MYSDYYGGDVIRGLTVLVAFLFSVPYLGIQLRASGALFNVLTDGMVSTNIGMILLSTVVVIYVASGGLKSVPYVDSAQAIHLALRIVNLGVITKKQELNVWHMIWASNHSTLYGIMTHIHICAI